MLTKEADGEFPQAISAALRFISYRPRSEAEVRRRLARSFLPPTIERTLLFLQENGYVDDVAFAQLWRRDRERRRPRGRRLLRQELIRFGVSREVVDEALEGFDSAANAYQASWKLAAKLVEQGTSPEVFRKKVGAHLQRRGFEYSVITETLNRLWRELTEA